MLKNTPRKRMRSFYLASRATSCFVGESLEPRRLLSVGNIADYMLLGTSLLSPEFSYANGQAITVNLGATIPIDVQVEGIAAAAMPTPTGTITISWHATGTSTTVNLNGIGGTGGFTPDPSGNIQEVAAASASITLPVTGEEAMFVQEGFNYFDASYSGDSNYGPNSTRGVFAVNFANSQQLSFITNPSNVVLDQAINPAVQVAVEDSGGQTLTSASDILTLAVVDSTGNTYPLGTAQAVNGIATFDNLVIPSGLLPAGSYTLKATDNANGISAVSQSFTIGLERLVFAQQPSVTVAGNVIQPSVTVSAQTGTGTTDTAAAGSVMLTLSSASQLNASTGTLGGTAAQPFVNGVATFNDLTVSTDGTYQLQASDSAGDPVATSDKFKIGSSSLQLEVNAKAPGGAKGVKTGDVIFYTVLEKPRKIVQTRSVVVTFPTGFVPTRISAGYTLSGNTITWTTNTRVFTFDMSVPSAAILNGIKNITVTGVDKVIYSDGSTDEAAATSVVKLATSFEVDGTLHDAAFKFPKVDNVSVAAPLAGVTVSLLDDTGAIVDSVVTPGSGKFSLTSKKGGTYTVQFAASGDFYTTASNGISTLRIYAGQQVTIPASNTTAIDLGDLVLPKTFFETSAGILQKLNNYTTSGFQNLASFDIDLFKFDTTAAEAAVNALAGTAAIPSQLMDAAALKPGGPADPWVAAIRMMAGLATIDSRFRDAFKLVDLSGKALSVTLSVAFVKKLQKSVGSFTQANPGLAAWKGQSLITQDATSQALTQGTRVALFTSLGAVVSSAYDKFANLAGIPVAYKGPTIAAIFTTLRYGYDFLTGEKLVDDLGFEAVFNLIRIAFDVALLDGFTGVQIRPDLGPIYASIVAVPALTGAVAAGVVPTMQDQVNATVNNRNSYDTITDTNAILSALKGYDDAAHKRALLALKVESAFNSISSIIRGGDGTLFLLNKANGAYASGLLGGAQQVLQKTLTVAETGLKTVTGAGAKVLSSELLIPTLASGAVGMLDQLATTQFIARIVQTGSTGSSATSVQTEPLSGDGAAPAIAFTPTAEPATLQAARLLPSAAAKGPAESAAYLADLTQLATLVKTGDTAGIATLYPLMLTDQQALFGGDLVVLDKQGAALLPQLATQAANRFSSFDTQLSFTLSSITYASEQLDLWGANPSTGDPKAVINQINLTISAVKSAVAQAGAVRVAVAGQSVRITIDIAESSVPTNISTGSMQTFTFTVTNLGSETSSPGTITFSNGDGSIILTTPADQSLPALAAGASATFSWQAQVNAPQNPDYGVVFEIDAVAGSVTNSFSDELLVE